MFRVSTSRLIFVFWAPKYVDVETKLNFILICTFFCKYSPAFSTLPFLKEISDLILYILVCRITRKKIPIDISLKKNPLLLTDIENLSKQNGFNNGFDFVYGEAIALEDRFSSLFLILSRFGNQLSLYTMYFVTWDT